MYCKGLSASTAMVVTDSLRKTGFDVCFTTRDCHRKDGTIFTVYDLSFKPLPSPTDNEQIELDFGGINES